jgi:hypothetical protein
MRVFAGEKLDEAEQAELDEFVAREASDSKRQGRPPMAPLSKFQKQFAVVVDFARARASGVKQEAAVAEVCAKHNIGGSTLWAYVKEIEKTIPNAREGIGSMVAFSKRFEENPSSITPVEWANQAINAQLYRVVFSQVPQTQVLVWLQTGVLAELWGRVYDQAHMAIQRRLERLQALLQSDPPPGALVKALDWQDIATFITKVAGDETAPIVQRELLQLIPNLPGSPKP